MIGFAAVPGAGHVDLLVVGPGCGRAPCRRRPHDPRRHRSCTAACAVPGPASEQLAASLFTWITVAAPAGTDALNSTATAAPNATTHRSAQWPDRDRERSRAIDMMIPGAVEARTCSPALRTSPPPRPCRPVDRPHQRWRKGPGRTAQNAPSARPTKVLGRPGRLGMRDVVEVARSQRRAETSVREGAWSPQASGSRIEGEPRHPRRQPRAPRSGPSSRGRRPSVEGSQISSCSASPLEPPVPETDGCRPHAHSCVEASRREIRVIGREPAPQRRSDQARREFQRPAPQPSAIPPRGPRLRGASSCLHRTAPSSRQRAPDATGGAFPAASPATRRGAVGPPPRQGRSRRRARPARHAVAGAQLRRGDPYLRAGRPPRHRPSVW